MDEFILPWHLNQVVPLLSKATNSRENGQQRVSDSSVLLSPQLGYKVSEANSGTSAADSRATVDNRLFRRVTG